MAGIVHGMAGTYNGYGSGMAGFRKVTWDEKQPEAVTGYGLRNIDGGVFIYFST